MPDSGQDHTADSNDAGNEKRTWSETLNTFGKGKYRTWICGSKSGRCLSVGSELTGILSVKQRNKALSYKCSW